MSLPDVTTEGTSPQMQLRKVATWLIGAFAVVGASISGSLSLKSLSDMPTDPTLQRSAVFGFLLAMLGITWAIVAISRVLIPSLYRESDARNDLRKPDSRHNTQNFGLFPTNLTPAKSLETIDQNLIIMNNPNALAGDKGTASDLVKAELPRFTEWMKLRAFEILLGRYNSALWQTILAAGAVALGLLLYAFSVSAPSTLELASRLKSIDDRDAAVTKREADVNLRESQGNTGLLTSFPRTGTWKSTVEMGKCPKDIEIPVIVNRVEKSEAYKAHLITASSSPCPNTELEVTSAQGTLTLPETTWVLP